MKKSEMDRIIKEETARIPKGDDAQQELRMLYPMMRRHDLSLGKSREETMLRAIESVKQLHPDWIPRHQ